MSISEKELKLLINFMKDDLQDIKKESTIEKKDQKVDAIIEKLQQYLED